jgi:hypothetical protein
MEATRHQIVSFSDLEKLIDQLTQAAHPSNPAAYRRAIQDFAIICARFRVDELASRWYQRRIVFQSTRIGAQGHSAD